VGVALGDLFGLGAVFVVTAGGPVDAGIAAKSTGVAALCPMGLDQGKCQRGHLSEVRKVVGARVSRQRGTGNIAGHHGVDCHHRTEARAGTIRTEWRPAPAISSSLMTSPPEMV
jgi:hypothetical protein